MTLSDWMVKDFDDIIGDLKIISDDLNSSKSSCCDNLDCKGVQSDLTMFNDVEEARLHTRVIAIIKRIAKTKESMSNLIQSRRGVDK